ncbi:MAG: hypothetical protein WCG67_07745 [Ferruginibacter sp.]
MALLFIVAVPLFFSVAFVIKQKLIQNQMKEKLEQATLQSISVPLTALNWFKKDKEAIINGKLFDVKEISISGNTVTLKGLFDNDEDQLVIKIKDIVKDKKSNGTMSDQLRCIFLPLYSETRSISLQSQWTIIAVNFYSYTKCTTEGHYAAVAPPPKHC